VSLSQATRTCPVCGKPVVAQHRPFCSRRCADVDLHRWLSGRYLIPGSEDAPDYDDAGEQPEPGDGKQ
jgi:endogenous inhibitor of DNA gyrase (YacG/DUF329 family)